MRTVAGFSYVLAVLAALGGCATIAPPELNAAVSGCATKATIGNWLYDSQGNKFGSVRALTDRGRSAVIMVGSYFEPGSHEAKIPACEITVAADGRATLHRETMEALNAFRSSRP